MEKPVFQFNEPKRKKQTPPYSAFPFPIPIQSICGLSSLTTNCFTGYLVGLSVHVTCSSDMNCLYENGFFGKGNMSWSGPEYKCMRQQAYTEHKRYWPMSRRRFLQHVNWAQAANGLALSPAGEDYQLPCRRKFNPLPVTTATTVLPSLSIGTSSVPINIDVNETFSELKPSGSLSLSEFETMQPSADIECDPWSAVSGQDSQAFWGQPSSQRHDDVVRDSESTVHLESSQNSVMLTDKFCGYPVMQCSEQSAQITSFDQFLAGKPTTAVIKNQESLVSDTEFCCNIDHNQVSSQTSVSLKKCNEVNDGFIDALSNTVCPVQVSDGTIEVKLGVDVDLSVSGPVVCETSNWSSHHKQLESDSCSDINNIATACLKSCDGNVVGADDAMDGRCLESDSEDGDVLVMDDTDDSDIDDSARLSRPTWQTVAKKDPYPLPEHLQLSLEEAFFLSYGLGCLVVNSPSNVAMNLVEMWQCFCESCPNFIERYVAYHNFRSKGWVPKPGLKFGADFVLYKRGPPFYHASYSVIVKQVRDVDLLSGDSTDQPMSWTMLSCLNRVTEQVSKELMICYIIRPTGLDESEFSSPLCISKFKIMEVVVRRWISKRERENAEFLLIP